MAEHDAGNGSFLDEELAARVAAAQRVVVFTGAGISAESGLATFRGPAGGSLWQRFRPEDLATPEAFQRNPEGVWSWYEQRYREAMAARPNAGHRALVRFCELFPSSLVVTQNVDRLHQRAGSPRVIELHGSLAAARCDACGATMGMEVALALTEERPPPCACGGRHRPAVVWFGEQLPAEAVEEASEAAACCDLFLVAGTSATVFPAAGLIEIAASGGAAVIEVNPEETAFSRRAQLTIRQAAGEALPALVAEIERCRRTS